MFRFLPWKFFVKRAARHYGVMDPAMLLARMRRFAQPSEVAEPLELLRAGIVFHARGLVNSKAIQHNLDWVWPYWVERQFHPESRSFVPRAFSFSHINLTHRNWTAVGLPSLALYPIVDPRGLVTPLYDGWSLDFWIVSKEKQLLPSQLEDDSVGQRLHLEPGLTVSTACGIDGMRLELATRMVSGRRPCPEAVTEVRARSDQDGWLVAAIRPYNPEGIQFIHKIRTNSSQKEIQVNDDATVRLDAAADGFRMGHYADGDIYLDLADGKDRREVDCEVGMATGAALFRLGAGKERRLEVSVDLEADRRRIPPEKAGEISWKSAMEGTARLRIPDERMRFLYGAAVKTLLLLSADDLIPGPYTYRRFWFRDACLMLHPLLAINQADRAARVLATFPGRQTRRGYFLSQEGEWDSNGQVLWIAARFAGLTGRELEPDLRKALRKAVRWLERKRLPEERTDGTGGLLPAGFSAEHLGPNDYYYWDDFWAWGGLKAMAAHWRGRGERAAAAEAAALAEAFAGSIRRSIEGIPESRARGAVPAAPGRRMDAGAIGSMVADYPLQLFPPGDGRMLKTARFLIGNCFHKGGFFQDMIHSGINAYLSLDLAQTLLRAGDPGYAAILRTVADLATPTGQWPEAIHPLTHGGCMGDGQHGWAAAEWIMMMRNCFVREEADHLVVGSGILPEWMETGEELSFGPTPTAWGTVTIRLADGRLAVEGAWREQAPRIEVAVPGRTASETDPFTYRLKPRPS
ncbi:MAG: hypothetical protein ACLFRP_08690 [Puniceicoccaceae bacterium]